MSGYVNTLEWYFTNLGIEKGIEQGRQLGLGQGAGPGAANSQLVRRFGDLPAWADSRLADADADTLERWSLQVLDARRLEDVFA